jgi:hypothetical protein
VCTAECTSESASRDCGPSKTCSEDGHCLGDGAGVTGDAASGNGGFSRDGSTSPHGCGEVLLKPTPKTPNVIVLVDQSGSMTAKFGSSTRWLVLKESLLADDGLIASLQSVVRFGVVLYSSNDGGPTCPVLTPAKVSVALDNLEGIRSLYQPAEPIADTPTGDAIDAVIQQAKDSGLINGPDQMNPTIIVLATDGEPDTCEVPNPQNGQAESVAAIENAYKAGVPTYVIAVANEDELSQKHVQDIANAGAGMKDAPSYRVQDDKGLRDALQSIVSGQLSCVVPLQGKVTAEDPCVGKVELDGKPLGCNDANGWRLLGESTIEIQGSACTALKSGGTLDATFPCDTAVVF